ncbi:pirin family protein [Balneatrix alpica]|uniref:Pirin family protein n=1 Tax=Balneatrix alpica TaxID=75684 RepID=A0ABV5ZBB1_9GAMM|nr:pirin family protein [Balneatrix alpica]
MSTHIELIPAASRGHVNLGWLDSHHSFSFGHYYDPQRMGVSVLRVINEDRVAPGQGFATHAHQDMEIISYLLEGRIEHRDTLGNRRQLQAGEIQVMSAGSGIQHSEYNPDRQAPLHFLQIWIRPQSKGIPPRYAEQRLPEQAGLQLLVSGDGRQQSLTIHQDALLYQLRLDAKQTQQILTFSPERLYFIQQVKGQLQLGEHQLQPGDGAIIRVDHATSLQALSQEATALLFDLPLPA